MTLRQKTLLIIGVTLVSLIGVLSSTSSTILLSGFSEVERQDTVKNVQRVQEALSDELNQLKQMTLDWAEWDETYAFIANANKRYIKNYLSDTSLAGLNLNLLLYTNFSGQVVYSKDFDKSSGRSIAVSQNFKKYLSADVLHHFDRNSSPVGLMHMSKGPMLIASRPILKTNGIGPSRGVLIMGRYLDAAAIEKLAEQTHLSITVHSIDDAMMPPDFQVVRASLLEKETISVSPLSKDTVAGYTTIKDVYGQPALILRVDIPRDIYKQGQVSIYYFIASLLVAGFAFTVATLLLLERLVLSRLARLSKDVYNIGTTGDLSARLLSIAGQDELSRLADKINGMLEALAFSQRKQREREERHYRYSRVLAELTKRQMQEHGDLITCFQEITEAAACALEVERASVWLFKGEDSQLQCVELYQRSLGLHSAGIELTALESSAYRQVLERERTVATSDVNLDPRVKELRESYLAKIGVTSMLNAPICFNGQVVGMVCHGHVGGTRQWLLEEHNFVASLADLAALLMEATERKRSQEALQKAYDDLEARMRERSELTKANQELQAEIQERHIAEEKLLHEALHDPLTDLPNRALFMQRLESAVERATEEHYLLAVLFLDLDRFKVINDTLGHLIGDELLVEVARRLQACLRPEDLVARLGGDEFTILLENIKDVSDATKIAERIQHELALPFNLSGHEVFTAASIGIALSTEDCDQSEDLLHRADVTMYRAKALGQGCYQVFEPNSFLNPVF